MIPNPKKVITSTDFTLIVEFENGELRRINIRDFLTSTGTKAQEIKNNIKLFQSAFVEDGAAISWPNKISIDPDHIYESGEVIQKLPATAISFSDKISAHYSST